MKWLELKKYIIEKMEKETDDIPNWCFEQVLIKMEELERKETIEISSKKITNKHDKCFKMLSEVEGKTIKERQQRLDKARDNVTKLKRRK